MPENIDVLPKTLTAFIWYFVKKQLGMFALMCVLGVLFAVNESLYPYFIKILVEDISKFTPGLDAPFKVLHFPLVGLGITWVVMQLSSRAYGVVAVYVWPSFRKNILDSVFLYTQGQSHAYFTEHLAGGLASKITGLPRACEHIVDILFSNFFLTMLTFLTSLSIIFKVSTVFGLILFGFVVLFVLVTLLSMHNIDYTAEVHAEAISALDGRIVDSLGGMLSVRLFARSDYERRYLERYQVDEMQKSKEAAWAIERMNLYRELLTLIFIVATFTTMIYGWNHGWVSLGDISLISMTFFNLVGAIWHSSLHITQIFKEIGASKSSLSLLSQPYSVTNKPDARPLFLTKGAIQFDKVTFAYVPGWNIFEDFSVRIEGGQKVGLVGFSGSGKTTFAHLIFRLYDVLGGKILIDGQDIASVTQETLWEQVAVVPQDTALFHRTVIENIQYGRLDASRDDVLAAAKFACCGEFARHLERGYNTVVGEKGAKLSGGQRQRVAIAQAVLKNAPILIMDEATSGLDSVTERMIQENLKNANKSCTMLVISHRLSTLNYMDRILVFHQGAIVEDGTLPGLLARRGHFGYLWEMQVDGFLPEQRED